MADKQIIMYSQERCGYCIQAKNWLTELNVPYEIRDINVNEEHRNEFKNLPSTGTPTFVIGEEVIIGLHKDKVQDAWEAYLAQ